MTDKISWPSLPTTGFIAGRSATTEDVDAGRAVFALKSADKYIGEPLDLDIPQYAIHTDQDSGKRTPVVVVQVETNGDIVAVGCISAEDGSAMAGLMQEFELLGTSTPS